LPFFTLVTPILVVISSERFKAKGDDDMALSEIKPLARKTDDIDDPAELEAGLVKLMPYLRAFARSLSGNPDLAEDLAQEALANAWRCRQSFSRGSNLKAWVFTILRNEFYSHRRRAWRQAPWDAEKAESIPAAPEEQDWSIELSDVASAMQSLPDPQREALMLVGVGGFTHDEAAVLAGSAVGTMKSRVARARASLRDILEGPRSIEPTRIHGTAADELLSQLSLAQSRVH
jgi:RNA polymerase sigma-70 factor, ECF subfamily